jgi:hypothetical protein
MNTILFESVHGEAVSYFGMAISKSTSALQLPGKLQLTSLYLPIYKFHAFIS